MAELIYELDIHVRDVNENSSVIEVQLLRRVGLS